MPTAPGRERPPTPTAIALVTGASGGIGEELAKLLAADRATLVLAARSAARLHDVADDCRRLGALRVETVAVDLASADGVSTLVAAVRSAGLRIDVLVNNAGFGLAGPFEHTALGDELEMIRLNVVSLTHLTKAFLPDLRAAQPGPGRLLNVASTAAFQPGPYMAVYYATKAYVLSFSEALAEELRGENVTVTALCPGPTRTGFAARAGMRNSRLFRMGVVSDARRVARAGYRGMLRGRRVVVPGVLNQVLVQANRISPRALTARVTRALNRGRSPA